MCQAETLHGGALPGEACERELLNRLMRSNVMERTFLCPPTSMYSPFLGCIDKANKKV